MNGKLHVFGSTLALVVVALAVAVPAALAGGGSNNDAFMRAVNARTNELSSLRPAAPDAFERALNARTNELSSPAQVPPDAFERALNARTQALAARQTGFGDRGPDLVRRSDSTTVAPTVDAGFDWAAAAVGGSAMLALVLLLGGGALVGRQTRSRPATR